ncbi:MAG: rhomboid family intramembrane serine protease [Ignavibacteria bacterium]|jgi:membrane associated rhomboid family serine protease
MTEEKEFNLKRLLFVPIFLPALLWAIHLFSIIFDLNLNRMGILPRDFFGSFGIITGPLIHADISHLISNTVPLVVLGWTFLLFHPKVSFRVFFVVYFLTGLLVWIFARPVFHIGASGIVYAFVSFLFFSGIFRRDTKSIGAALIVTFLYGGIVWGILPGQAGISWESHLFGGIAGMVAAFIFRKLDPPKRYDWEDEPDDFNVDDLEVSYDPDKNKF